MSKDANDPTWQTEEETKFYQKIEDDLEAESRPSDAPAQGPEARPGVGIAVESHTADEKGLASRVEELEEMVKDLELWQDAARRIDAVQARAIQDLREQYWKLVEKRALAGKKE